jgi:hypothetical protein
MMNAMAHGPVEITHDLSDALVAILGAEPTEPEPVVVLSAYLHGLAKGYGLSESQLLTESQLERAEPPEPARKLVNYFLGGGAESIDGGLLRDLLYSVFDELSRDSRARKALNKNEPLSEVGLLKVAQIFWNLEASETRRSLPIPSGQYITIESGETVRADIKVPDANEDFATMKWSDRTKRGATGLGAGQAWNSSGQGFRDKGARLAVMAAQLIIEHSSEPWPTLEDALLSHTSSDRGRPRLSSIVWPEDEPGLATPATAGADRQRRGLDAGQQGASDHRSVVEHSFARMKLASVFEGRETELDELVEFCTTDDEQLLLVVGERYSGKSALMAEFFVNAEAPDVVRLGYFVPPNQRQDARSVAMVRHLVRQAYLLTTGEELHIDSSNPGRLRELLASCVGQARQDGRSVVLMVDGIDEDVSSRLQEQTMMSVLGELSVPGLKVIVSAWSGRIPEAAAGWRQLPVRRTEYVAECLKQMEAELESLFDQAPTRGILQYLTFGFGAFQAARVSHLRVGCGAGQGVVA